MVIFAMTHRLATIHNVTDDRRRQPQTDTSHATM